MDNNLKETMRLIDKEIDWWKKGTRIGFKNRAKQLLEAGFTSEKPAEFLISLYHTVSGEYGN